MSTGHAIGPFAVHAVGDDIILHDKKKRNKIIKQKFKHLIFSDT